MADEDLEQPFLFKSDEKSDWKNLHQGDLLVNTDPLSSAITEAHPFYATTDDYTHFMVLSQSCDLVRRKTKYITLAAVRPVETAITREIEKVRFKDIDFPFLLSNEGRRQELKFTLERFVNNTVEDYFFISKHWHPKITENLCVFLPLSIALHARKHYEACLACKIGELEDIFAAKVGWATGHMYSKVATSDLIEKYDESFDKKFKEKFSEEVLFPEIIWYHQSQVDYLKKLIADWKKDNPDKTIDKIVAKTLFEKVPSLEDMLLERVTDMLVRQKFIRSDIDDASNKVKKILGNNNRIRHLLKQMRAVT